MDLSTPTVSPLRQRMLDDMRMRKLDPKTQVGYVRAVLKLAAFLERSPKTATVEGLQLFPHNHGLIQSPDMTRISDDVFEKRTWHLLVDIDCRNHWCLRCKRDSDRKSWAIV